jgi:beta-glucosidase
MADGPAGVRIAAKYYVDKKGKHAIGSVIPAGMIELMPKIAKRIMSRATEAKKGAEIFEQYTTAIPIATALAQSFDTDFVRMCGDIVGSEMSEFGVDLWLAPALNIHRSVLCGRNFEYYSEDPLLSGKMAAAVTQGVQAHPGCGVTIKHFAANNQETNRYGNNSAVSERALREIYLKGFEICIRESDPMALMTSYNLINGTHTSESRELVTALLRDEYGFDGLVMTDWVVGGGLLLQRGSKYGMPDAAKVAASGHSLFMPGSRKDLREVMAGLKDGTVTGKQLISNASWLLHVADRLGK